MFRLFRIGGISMEPTLESGAVVLAVRWPRRLLKAGMVVAVNAAPAKVIVKRIAAITPHDEIVLESDNAATASRYCGVPLPRDRVIGRVVLSRYRADQAKGSPSLG